MMVAAQLRKAGINVCSGGIVGMGETRADRVGFVHTLATLEQHPESVPVNALVPVKGTVLGDMLADTPLAKIDDIEFVRTIAVARITMPMSMVRLSAGRESMSEATQALCFMAGANSIFTGDKLPAEEAQRIGLIVGRHQLFLLHFKFDLVHLEFVQQFSVGTSRSAPTRKLAKTRLRLTPQFGGGFL